MQSLPNFDDAFQATTPLFYFHHIIDPEQASLRVEVLGPNLTYTFSHTKIKSHLSPSEISKRLRDKTVGFLALVTANGQRIVLAWAESGHGHGLQGDTLDDKPTHLSNKIWTQRVMRIARRLGVSMRHPYDGRLASVLGLPVPGVYASSHVEVKLAAHAIYVLLGMFNIKHGRDDVLRGDLRQLRRVVWEDGSRPAFEIFFSRAPCERCVNIVRKLEAMTGISISLLWRERLVKIEYEKNAAMQKPPPLSRANAIPPPEPQDDDVITLDSVDLTGGPEPEKEKGNPSQTIPRAKVPRTQPAREDITKPLPATPAIEAPWWLTSRQQQPPPPPPPQTHDNRGVIEERPPTPPSSGGVISWDLGLGRSRPAN